MRLMALTLLLTFTGCASFSSPIIQCKIVCGAGKVSFYKDESFQCGCAAESYDE